MARTNRTRYVVLGLLSMGPRSGYDIRREVSEITSYFWQESYGQIYPVLGHLTQEGLIRRKTERAGRRTRHVYRITSKGRQALVRWLHAPVEVEAVRRELLLKLFFGRNVPARVLAGHVAAFRERALQLGRRVAQIEQVLRREPGIERDLPYWLLTTRFGAQISRAFSEWSEFALQRLGRGSSAGRARVRRQHRAARLA